jgi:hypothetical protein
VERAYGTDENPPRGYSTWDDVNPALDPKFNGFSKTHWVKKIA